MKVWRQRNFTRLLWCRRILGPTRVDAYPFVGAERRDSYGMLNFPNLLQSYTPSYLLKEIGRNEVMFFKRRSLGPKALPLQSYVASRRRMRGLEQSKV